MLRQRVYDMQCGAKLFRNSALLRSALEERSRGRWAFDVELLLRLLLGTPERPGAVREIPLEEWIDVPGFKVGLARRAWMGVELAAIALRPAQRRRRIEATAGPTAEALPHRPSST